VETPLTSIVPQSILDRLTDVAMPRLASERPSRELMKVGAYVLPVQRSEAVVLGSGAAGLRAAVEMKRRNVDVVIASQSAFGGTSACSGSDKQTLHTANSAGRGDDFRDLADALAAGGAMDEDTAYVEAVGSVRALASLQFMGLPLPQDRFGGVASGETRRVIGVLAMAPKRRAGENPYGLTAFLSNAVVIATGGPGELYRDSVYPRHCFGSLGLALEAGIEAVNLTESQFGISTPRNNFPWNLSGTYVQCMPYIFSRDGRGSEHNFLADYYRTTRELASNIFRKGYQWPFHATRMLEFGSSLLDLAVFRESQAGRKVFIDFNRNPLPVPGDTEFSLDRLDDDVRSYLANSGALLAQPIDRLRKMNPLSIELYKRYKYDIARDPLEFAINNQHMNGGLAVNTWGATNLEGCYAVGESAGTHGVTRPGGAALNAGQVFGTRCAEHVAARRTPHAEFGAEKPLIEEAVANTLSSLQANSTLKAVAIQKDVQDRMSDHAAILCNVADVKAAADAARGLNETIRQEGIAFAGANEALRALQWRQMAIASEAVLTALAFYLQRCGGSRGARTVCSPGGDCVPQSRSGPLDDVRFISERDEHQDDQIHVRLEGTTFVCETRPIRRRDPNFHPFFERDWPDYLTGAIHDASA